MKFFKFIAALVAVASFTLFSAHLTAQSGVGNTNQQSQVAHPAQQIVPDSQRLRMCYRLDETDAIMQSFSCLSGNVSQAAHDCVQVRCPKAISNGGRNRCWRCGRSDR